MKPITNSRYGLPLIIFPGKVTQSGTLWNPANCIVCSQHWAGSYRALLGSGEPPVPQPPAGEGEEPTAKTSWPPTWLMDPGSGWSPSCQMGPASPAAKAEDQMNVPSYLGIRRKCLHVSLWKLFCFHLSFKINCYLFSSLEKKGRENFGWKNPWPSSGTWEGCAW